MELDWSAIVVNAIGGFIGALASAAFLAGLVAFTAFGRNLWGAFAAVKGLRSVAIFGALAFIFSGISLGITITKTESTTNDLKIELVAGTIPSPGTKADDGNFVAAASPENCPEGSILINAYCSTVKQNVAAGVLRAAGLQNDRWFSCTWSGVVNPQGFSGQVQPMCLRLVKK